jgi:hypothetical protein
MVPPRQAIRFFTRQFGGVKINRHSSASSKSLFLKSVRSAGG